MSILNIALQNCATERSSCDNPSLENQLKKCHSMADIRKLHMTHTEVKDAWLGSLKDVQEMISERFSRLELKDKPFQNIDTITDDEILHFQRRVSELFPGIENNTLQKQHTNNIESYNTWKQIHCNEEHYAFQVKKCDDISCCSPPRIPREKLTWLHGSKSKTTISMSAQNARAVINCVECEQPRVIYAKSKLDNRQRLLLAKNISIFEYSCGSFLFPPTENGKLANSMIIRPNLQCAMEIEVPYYSSDVGRKDVCSHCGRTDAAVIMDLKKQYKTVLPIGKPCQNSGKKPFTHRQFGKK